jgi:hypothetical protein
MNGSDDADEKIEADLVADLKARLERFRANARDARLTIGLIGERVMHVVGQLAMNADRLHPVQHAFAGSL